jgi:hypothetical protein
MSISPRRFLPAALFAFALFAGAPASSYAVDCPAAGAVKAAAASFSNAARAHSAASFSSALSRHTNVSSLALFALGPYRKKLPAGRQGEYVRSAHRYMGHLLANNAGRISASGLKVSSCKGNLVETQAGGREITWRVSGGRIQDVKVGGVWLAGQLRSKFTGMIRSRGGDVNAFVDALSSSKVAAN